MRTSPSSEPRLRAAVRALEPEQRLSAICALVVGGSVFLPWWHDPFFDANYVGVRRLTFVEVALCMVAASVLLLLVRRAEGKVFHLPLSDGTLVAAAGAWSSFLVVFRMLDPPTRTVGRTTTDYGMRWGLLVALTGAVVLTVAGWRTRLRYHSGEPEAVAADADATPTVPLSH